MRGQGLLQAIEFDSDIANSIVRTCLEKGLLINQVKPNAVRFMPPLIITEEDVDQAMQIIMKVLAEVGEETSYEGQI